MRPHPLHHRRLSFSASCSKAGLWKQFWPLVAPGRDVCLSRLQPPRAGGLFLLLSLAAAILKGWLGQESHRYGACLLTESPPLQNSTTSRLHLPPAIRAQEMRFCRVRSSGFGVTGYHIAAEPPPTGTTSLRLAPRTPGASELSTDPQCTVMGRLWRQPPHCLWWKPVE